jgi:hypothetical protein
MPPLAVGLLFSSWLLRLWYDSSSSREEAFWAWLFWPAVAATLFVSIRALFVWLPQGARAWVVAYPWQFEAVRIVCGVVGFASLVVLGRAAIFIKSDNWFFESAWVYYSAPALLIVTGPVLTFVAAVALWPQRGAQSRLRDLLSLVFGVIALFTLAAIWSFLSRVGCEVCSGPAL